MGVDDDGMSSSPVDPSQDGNSDIVHDGESVGPPGISIHHITSDDRLGNICRHRVLSHLSHIPFQHYF